ncbi:MAG TPA: hypothetical protein VF134_05130 [Candidatus Dormibacteraeota bacterium]
MNDSLFLPHPQGVVRPLSGWECAWLPLGEGEAEGLPSGRGSGWRDVGVPAQQAAVEGRSAIWYRTSFARPDHSGRVLVRFQGAFLAANVWLNGRLLGSHYGYFAPFGFDLTPHLRPENLLVVCCESPVERDPSRKRHVMGWFNDSDSRPYPLPWLDLPGREWEVPLGLWAPVDLEFVDSVIVDGFRVRPRLEADVGRVEVDVHLRNLDGREMAGEVGLEVGDVRLRREYRIGGGLEQGLAVSLSLPGARRWSPWRLGEPHLHTVRVEMAVAGRRSGRVEDRFGFRDLDFRIAPDGCHFRINGRPMFLRGANYLPSFRLDQLNRERFDADIRMAREANLDALRVHAHVLPPDFYAAADAAGMLVLAELPLTGPYAYHASGEEARFFEQAVRAQVAELVGLVANRPSVVAWLAHDDPAWIASRADLADVHAVRQNYTLDQEAKALFEELDAGDRPALAASGELDSHLWAGWREAGWETLREAEPVLVTEYGAQALPAADSPVWEEIGRRWPVAGEEPGWLATGLEAGSWAEHGVGLASDFADLAGYIEVSQDYQAFLVSYAADQFRRRKFERCWGAFVYHLVDPFPGIGFGMLDAARRPRAAYSALAEAMAPVRVIVDPVGFQALRPAGFGYHLGDPVVMRLVVVNDDPTVSGPARLKWWVDRQRAPERAGVARLREVVRRKSFSGEVACSLPTAFEPALQAVSVTLPISGEGDYRLEAQLSSGAGVLAVAGLDFSVGASLPPGEAAPLPRHLAERILDLESLAVDGSELRFELHNRARPAALTRLSDLRLDGLLLARARVLLETPSGRVPLPRRVELPVGRRIGIHVEMEREAETDARELQFEIAVAGIGSGRVAVLTTRTRLP